MHIFDAIIRNIIPHTFFICLLAPIALLWVNRKLPKKFRKAFQWVALILSIFIILRLTVLGRPAEQEGYNFTLFWTYSQLHDAQFRQEILHNILLFVPLGFMLGWAAHRKLWQAIVLGFTLSFAIEAVQYYYHLGFSEADDVFHNTLGTAMGYGYWTIVKWMQTHHYIEQIKRTAYRESKAFFNIVIAYLRRWKT